MNGIFLCTKKEISIGRSAECDIACKDIMELSKIHLIIRKRDGSADAVMYGRNGGIVAGKNFGYGEGTEIDYGDEIKLYGLNILWLDDVLALNVSDNSDCNVSLEIISNERACDHEPKNTDVEDGETAKQDFFTKSPRAFHVIDSNAIELDAPPEKHEGEKQNYLITIGPAMTMALPMIMGFLVARISAKNSYGSSSAFMYTGVVTAVVSALMGVIWAVTNIRNRKKQQQLLENRRKRAYTEYVRNAEAQIRERYNTNAGNLRLMYPEIGEYVKDSYNRYILWNRNKSDEDFLKIRLGTGNVAYDLSVSIPKERFSVSHDELKELPGRLKRKYSIIKDVPITIDLSKDKCVGVIAENKEALSRLFLEMIMSAAVALSPEDVRFICLFENDTVNEESLIPVKYVPHIFYGNKRMLGMNHGMVSNCIEVIKELTGVGTNPGNESLGARKDESRAKEHTMDKVVIVFTDCTNHLPAFLKQMNGVHIVVFSDSFLKLPPDITLLVQNDKQFSGYLSVSRDNKIRQSIHFDDIEPKEADRISRILRGIKYTEETTRLSIPDSLSFYTLTGKRVRVEDIVLDWTVNTTEENIKAALGISENGEIEYLDFHERKMGPHGLIAGTTGSGKSELLQTIILSLSITYSPLEAGFFLIDYKGGGMSSLFSRLPHLLGSISNLSGRMIFRAMASVRSENERRQRIFISSGVNNISEYQSKYRSKEVSEPMPHIFIIIDEFAELKKEEPEFMKELISVARVGRSLGIHLILATQKPAGVVDDNILSNSRFRICLRVQDRMDSMEMLHRPDAAYIKQTGRAYLQVGNDEYFSLFQGAYTMDKSLEASGESKVRLTDKEFRELSRKLNSDENEYGEEPQLNRVIDEICTANEAMSYEKVNSLWLEPLGDNIFYEGGEKDSYEACIGIYDDPFHQRQDKLFINIKNTGHHVILGTLQSGKSTLLSTISYALLRTSSPDMINMYFIDFSQGLLRPFKESILTGIYICDENEKDIRNLFILIMDEIKERKQKLSGTNFRQYMDLGNAGGMPMIVLMIDGIAALREKTSGEFDADLMKILKSGEALGIYVIATAINISAAELPARMFENFNVCIPLMLRDRYEYKEALRVQSEQIFMPEEIRGRGLIKLDEGVYEFQAYNTLFVENEYKRNETLTEEIKRNNRRIIDKFGERSVKELVKKVPVIPKNPTFRNLISAVCEMGNELFFRDEYRTGENLCEDMEQAYLTKEKYQNIGIPAAFEEDSGRVFYIPFRKNTVVFISGRSGSGKKNLLSVIAGMVRSSSYYRLDDYVNQQGTDINCKEEDSLADYPSVNKSINNEEYEYIEIFKHDDEKNSMKVIIYDETLPFSKLNELKVMAGNNPCAIHMGGALDRATLGDYSYIPYSKQVTVKNSGMGTVRKYDADSFYGDIIVPLYTGIENI